MNGVAVKGKSALVLPSPDFIAGFFIPPFSRLSECGSSLQLGYPSNFSVLVVPLYISCEAVEQQAWPMVLLLERAEFQLTKIS